MTMTTDSQAKLCSLLFQKIALNVLESSKNHVNPFIEKKTLEKLLCKDGELSATVKEVLKLFGENERIDIIDNKDLDAHLQVIANLENISPDEKSTGAIASLQKYASFIFRIK